jgi:DNA-binding PadR family transcriptional regulator
MAVSRASRPKISPAKRELSSFLQRPQGAPRGLLHFYILHLISKGPTHGYEISQSIEEKTEGSWRPGAGSIYPTLKKLVREGLIRTSSKTSLPLSSQRVYEITPKGMDCLREGKDMFTNAGKKWSSMRAIFVELMDPSDIPSFIVEGSKASFQMSRYVVDSKFSKMSEEEAEFTLKEYALNLERQLTWTKSKLQELQAKQSRDGEAAAPKVVR